MKLVLLSIFIFFSIFSKSAFANASMPAFWNVGNAQNPTIFDKKNKTASENIQMSSEKVSIMLYPNFSVVKGEYFMTNSSKEDIVVEVGYPENEVFKNSEVSNIVTNKIFSLKVFFDDKEINYKNNKSIYDKKWFVWNNEFKSGKKHKITVYFITDNHYAKLSQGYDSSKSNGFTYIVESGQVWKDKIDYGEIYVKLMDSITLDNIIGVLPKNLNYDKDSKTIIYNFKNLEPNSDNNLLIRYKVDEQDFDFTKVESNSKSYFDEIDKFKYPDKNAKTEPLEKDDFSIPFIASFSFYLILLASFFFVLLVIIMFVLTKITKKMFSKSKK